MSRSLADCPGPAAIPITRGIEDVEPLAGIIAFRPEASLLYINAETVLETVLATVRCGRRT